MKTNREFIGRHPFVHEQPKQTGKVGLYASGLVKRFVTVFDDIAKPKTVKKYDQFIVPHEHPTPRQLVAAGPMAHESMQVTVSKPSPAITYFYAPEEYSILLAEKAIPDSDNVLSLCP